MDLWPQLSPDWQQALGSVRSQISAISEVLTAKMSDGVVICPSPDRIFAALGPSPKQIKVIILGQDPYPNPSHATGLAFAVPKNSSRLPPTLKNILKEVQSDLNLSQLPECDLASWQSQGVLLLNTLLSTESGQSLAHSNIDWKPITDEIIHAVLRANPTVIAVLWGNFAQTYQSAFESELVIASVHPSPLSAYRGFFGSKPFSKVNHLLLTLNQEPIDWQGSGGKQS